MTDKNQWQKYPDLGVIVLFIIVICLFCADLIKKANPVTPVEVPVIPEISYKMPASDENIVVFNPKSLKYHKEFCEWAIKCKRCIKITETNAVKRGGKPCKVCGKAK